MKLAKFLSMELYLMLPNEKKSRIFSCIWGIKSVLGEISNVATKLLHKSNNIFNSKRHNPPLRGISPIS